MFKYPKIYFIITIFISAFYASDYNTLVLLEFENTTQNKEYDNLRHRLPDLIKDSILLDNNINVEYAGEIEPYLGVEKPEYENALLLLGRFSIEQSQIEVSLELYDLSTWLKVSKDFYFCHVSDEICFSNELMNYSTNLLPLYFTDYVLENNNDLLLSQSNQPDESTITDDLFISIDNFAVEAELNYSWEKLSKEGSQYGDRYYKDISEKQKDKLIANSREKNTERLISYFNKIILNPYDVVIQAIKMDYDEINSEYVDLTIPVIYNIKKSLIEDMLTTLPHLSTSHSIGNLVIKFSESDFILSNSDVGKYGFMKYQVVPVLFLSDDIGRTNYIYVDDFQGINDLNTSIFAESSIQFYPLFSITPGKDNIQINLDMTSLSIEYKFRVSVDEIKQYSKVAIKFLHKSEIESIVNKIYASDDE